MSTCILRFHCSLELIIKRKVSIVARSSGAISFLKAIIFIVSVLTTPKTTPSGGLTYRTPQYLAGDGGGAVPPVVIDADVAPCLPAGQGVHATQRVHQNPLVEVLLDKGLCPIDTLACGRLPCHEADVGIAYGQTPETGLTVGRGGNFSSADHDNCREQKYKQTMTSLQEQALLHNDP